MNHVLSSTEAKKSEDDAILSRLPRLPEMLLYRLFSEASETQSLRHTICMDFFGLQALTTTYDIHRLLYQVNESYMNKISAIFSLNKIQQLFFGRWPNPRSSVTSIDGMEL